MPAENVSDNVAALIDMALAEDFGPGDVTSTYFVPEHLTARAILTPRKKGVLSGVNVAAEVFRKVDPGLKVEVYLHDGEAVAPGAVVMLIEGSARSILGAERTALNFIQRLSGVASLTRKYVKAVSHTSARILDTRKTTPGYRLLEKAAVGHGGGTNHRMGLYDRAMVKDNHLMTDGNTEHLQKCINTLRAEKPFVEVFPSAGPGSEQRKTALPTALPAPPSGASIIRKRICGAIFFFPWPCIRMTLDSPPPFCA